ncbi:ATP-binding protein [Serratia odorifera]|uniref:histidine kinase n=1 Tax=Serratia odorifera DSM 4582 TaxID=667129 RepID=D4E504_SEROD|nr:ATP-binding protein [Serratia odorifera]EFE95200.1 PAS domain S-box protein [Serratia odorifera DSM 4582]RII70560.1 response regulator [Serratia odorifera]HEJ9094111.1 response regulator [Serratia odorifera]
MNLMRWLLPLLLLPAWGWSAEPLQIGLLRDRLPYSDLDAQRQPQGAASDLLSALSTQSGLHFSAQAASNRDQLAQMLSQQRILLALPPPQSSPPPTGILLSKPLWQQRWALVVRRDSLPLQHQLMPDLRHQRLLSLRHSPVQAALLTTYPGVALGEAATLHEALRLLNAGAAQGIVCDATQAALLASNLYPGRLLVRPLPAIVSTQRLWLAADQHALLDRINQAIDALPDGMAQSINQRWLLNAALNGMLPAPSTARHWLTPLAGISAALSLFLIGFLLSEIFRRRRAERGLRDALKYWQTLLNSIPTPLLVCDPLGKITHCNQALLTSLALSHQQVIGSTLEHFTAHHPIAPPIGHQERIAAIGSMQPQFSDRTMVIRGEQREIAQWLAAYSDSRMTPQGLLLGWYDISQRKRLERDLADALQQATDASREKSDFLARMSHEIRSPMNAILGILELESQRPDAADSSLPIAYAASRQLLQIVGDVLDISKIEAGELHLQPQPTALYPLLTQLLETYATLAAQKALRLDSDIEAAWQCDYLLDGTKLTQVLNNLLSNAIKYTERGFVALQVSVQSQDTQYDRVTFSITDSGIGIAPQMQQKILQPYVQADPNTPASTGLGLAICTQLVQLLGGELQIDSAPQHGSRFSFTLSLPRSTVHSESQTSSAPSALDPALHILVVDDLPANLTVMKLQLEKLGHHVTTCDNGMQALQWLERQHADLVLTDCQMPTLSGYQLAQTQRERERGQRRYQPIVGCTANAFNDEQRRCLAAGMDAVLIKPLTQKDLRNLLQEQRAIGLNMQEIRAMSDGQPQVLSTLIDELQRSSEADRQQLLANAGQPEAFAAVLHRQKGSFALAGYQSAVTVCQQLEQEPPTSAEPTVALLRLNALTLRFIALLELQRPSAT